jgi:selenocysteine lyase/cysteine desulfurase
MQEFLELAGGNPGRAGHRLSIEAGRRVYAARESIA